MLKSEYDAYVAAMGNVEGPQLRVEDVAAEGDRTLIYGYTGDRNHVHVYLRDGELHWVVYDYSDRVIAYRSGVSLPVELLVPSKRAYPQYTDFEAAALMRSRGAPVTFTTWSEPDETGPFAGRLRHQLVD